MLKVRKKERDSEIPSSSMADVAFLLLVFFLVTTTIDMQKGMSIILPEDESDFVKLPPENLSNVLINEYGAVLLDNEPVEISEIREIIVRKMEENPNLVVSLKAVRKTKYKSYIKVFSQLREARAKISIAEPDVSE
jgi:biopolymer transport protein ExbD